MITPQSGQVLTVTSSNAASWVLLNPQIHRNLSYISGQSITCAPEPKNDDFGITSTILNTIITHNNDSIEVKFFPSEKYPEINNGENALIKINETTLVCGNITLIFIKPEECNKFYFTKFQNNNQTFEPLTKKIKLN